MKASVSILKAQLSRYLHAVKGGEEVIVTERGRPIARLSPLDPTSVPEGRAAELVRQGRMRAPVQPGSELPGGARPADPKGRSLAILLEERARGR